MDREQVLLAQYRECWREISDYDQLIWQTPTVTVAIVSFFAIAYVQGTDAITRLFLSLCACGITFMQLHALTKHRFFQEVRTTDFEKLQQQIGERVKEQEKKAKNLGPMFEVLWKSDDILDKKYEERYAKDLEHWNRWRWWHNAKSYRLMRDLLAALACAWLVLSGFQVGLMLHQFLGVYL